MTATEDREKWTIRPGRVRQNYPALKLTIYSAKEGRTMTAEVVQEQKGPELVEVEKAIS